MAILLLLQIALYVAGILLLRDSRIFDIIKVIFTILSVLSVVWIVGSKSNPGYKIGWIILILALVPFGALAYILLGGNKMSGFNQRRLRVMDRRMRHYLGGECERSRSLAVLVSEEASCTARYLERTSVLP